MPEDLPPGYAIEDLDESHLAPEGDEAADCTGEDDADGDGLGDLLNLEGAV